MFSVVLRLTLDFRNKYRIIRKAPPCLLGSVITFVTDILPQFCGEIKRFLKKEAANRACDLFFAVIEP